jgi:hypothetical protein
MCSSLAANAPFLRVSLGGFARIFVLPNHPIWQNRLFA